MYYNGQNELYHYGVLGMKWGVRRYQNKDGTLTAAGRKRQAKQDYKTAKKTAKENLRSDKRKADEQYEQDVSARTRALAGVKKKYDIRDAETNKYFEREIGNAQKKADSAKSEMDFWNEGTDLHNEARNQYVQATSAIKDLQVRREAAIMANKFARDNETIKVSELYSETTSNASSRRVQAYADAGKRYYENIVAAKREYKEAKRRR